LAGLAAKSLVFSVLVSLLPTVTHSVSAQSTVGSQEIESAVKSGRVDSRVAQEVAQEVAQSSKANFSPVRALVIQSSPDKSSLEAISGMTVANRLPSLGTTVVQIESASALAELASLPDVTVVKDELLQRSDYSSEAYVGASEPPTKSASARQNRRGKKHRSSHAVAAPLLKSIELTPKSVA
jgi:hypothetical protein